MFVRVLGNGHSQDCAGNPVWYNVSSEQVSPHPQTSGSALPGCCLLLSPNESPKSMKIRVCFNLPALRVMAFALTSE